MKSYPTTDEKELLLMLRDGDRSAFSELYNRYKVGITIKLFQLVKADALVEDILQELFFRVWDKRKTIDPEKSIAAYLLRIATNLSYDHFRDLARKEHFITSKEIPISSDTADLYKKELDEALYRLIDELPQQRKKVFLLCKFENKSYEEVAGMLGISTHAVKDHIVKANRFLQQ
ncbi:sigma-70 family RNA polymerase sigma factor [Chryseobacterium indologenes]|uniref:RNA polymerase sigma factor n=1 Tax=Chryseobacterium indologenes TaxID=253 RepID=UPI00076E4A30|nr:sigma-70 family RNA polymerase sigma factor [Chryseobacterium indologenes]TLX24935.1 sigma-70 family RNA polymerase sigma factor [Chryseobacterium indologenes]